MAFWRVREELSQAYRLRRSYYELLRDRLDQHLTQYALVDSLQNFRSKKKRYPFVEKRELKPRARIPTVEYECQNTFLLIFIEDTISEAHKKYIRFFEENKTVKQNLLKTQALPLLNQFDRNQKYLESVNFSDLLKTLLPIDYALLIQRDPGSKTKNRYSLSHFHVRIDWPIADAAEDLAGNLRYISKYLYEKGDKYAEDIQKKFFEYYCQPLMVGGRRTAGIVAAQYLKRIPCISTIYVGSCETRALIRISERGVSKLVLMKFSDNEMNRIAEANQLTLSIFRNNYVVSREKKSGICVFQATYGFTNHSRPPDDGKLRDLNPDLYWLTVSGQHILPKPYVWKYPPISLNVIYT